MKTLLITYYWAPFNHSGTFRWLHMGEFLEFDVLTSTKPKGAFYDETIPKPDKRVFRYGFNLRPILWGFRTYFYLRDHKYDLYVFTSPPFSMALTAYLMQRRGRTVVLDLRDSLPFPQQKWYEKAMNPIYKYYLNKIKNITSHYEFVLKDSGVKGKVIYNGYKDL